MRNQSIFKFRASEEQILYTKQLVEYSIENHPITDVYANDRADTYGLSGVMRSQEYRFVGSLGEVLFADVYGLPRPRRSFGAIDGQDYGRDFTLPVNGQSVNVDLKTMHRNFRFPFDYYVLDLPAYQLNKLESQTDCYFHISLSYDRMNPVEFIAYFIGFISKDDIQRYGEWFAAGSLRPNDSGREVLFSRETYEVMFGDFLSPPMPPACENLPDFQIIRLTPTQKYKSRRFRLDIIKKV